MRRLRQRERSVTGVRGGTSVSFGAIKVWAQRFVRGQAIPWFRDRRINIEIDAHVERIRAAQTRRKAAK